jgi:energy-coupling factor transporter ATP-binding protein EcfA2
MIDSLRVNGYRGFSKYTVRNLGRINLLVGQNNCGKTSLLEALHLLWANQDLNALWQTLSRRGEQPVVEQVPGRGFQQEVDVSHCFTGHRMTIGESEFTIAASNDIPSRSVKYQIVEPKPEENPTLFNQLLVQDPGGAGMALKISGDPKIEMPPVPLTRRGGLRQDVFNQAVATTRIKTNQPDQVQFITTESLNAPLLTQIWNDIALNPEEDLVLRALRFIDPGIERIAPLTSPFWFSPRGGFIVRRAKEDRVPIGSFGDGIWRMLALAIALSRVKNGLLLVDEIDTGLHFSVMTKMWKFVDEVSKEFNVQVFATTHSYDCIHSLAAICRDIENPQSQITIHRIESGKSESVPFTEAQIKIASDRDLEIR